MKIFNRYSEFVRNMSGLVSESTNYQIINENVDQAKTYMKNRLLAQKRERQPDQDPKTIGLTPNEVRMAENDSEFRKVREVCGSDLQLVFTFTKFYFEDLIEQEPQQRLDELRNLIPRLKDPALELPRPLTTYVSKAADAEERQLAEQEGRSYRKAFERLIDDIERSKGLRATKRWVDQLLSWQKVWFQNMSAVQMKRVEGIAKAFDDFGKETDGTNDLRARDALQKVFFKKVLKYKTLVDLLSNAENYIKSANNASVAKFLKAVEKANAKYGENNGAEEVYFENNILILWVKSFVTNKELNSNTSHCIANSQGMWDSYCGDNKFTKQYYIYDFNLSPADTESIIGITIGEGGKITACHKKDDGGFMNNIRGFMDKRGIQMDILAPMTTEEIEFKKRRMAANREIIRPGISIPQVQQCLDDGADVNAQNGAALLNSVKEDNLEKSQFLLEMGAAPNLCKAINSAKNLPMIKLLVDYKSEMNAQVFQNIMRDYEAVEYVLAAGVDPNFDKGTPLRKATEFGDLKLVELLMTYNADVSLRKYLVLKVAIEKGQIELAKLFLDKLVQQRDDLVKDPAKKKEFFDNTIKWSNSSDQLNAQQKKDLADLLGQY